MNYYQLEEAIYILEELFDLNLEFFLSIKKVGNLTTRFMRLIEDVLDTNVTDNAEVHSAFDEIKDDYVSIQNIILEYAKPRYIFSALSNLESEIKKFNLIINFKITPPPKNTDDSTDLLIIFNDFVETYEEFVRFRNIRNTIEIIKESNRFYNSIKSLYDHLTSIRKNFEKQDTELLSKSEELGLLTLYFPSESDYFEFNPKIDTLIKLYNLFCDLLSISQEEYPLKVIKYEIGSEFIKVLGNKTILSLIEVTIKSFAGIVTSSVMSIIDYIYKNHTQDGKLKQSVEKLEAIKSLLNLKQILEEANIPTSRLNKNIEEATFEISEQIVTLLQRETKVSVNGEIIELGIASIQNKPENILPEPTTVRALSAATRKPRRIKKAKKQEEDEAKAVVIDTEVIKPEDK